MKRFMTTTAVFAMAIAFLAIDTASAYAWRVGNWTGAAFRSRSTGAFSYCQMSVRYKSGIRLWFRQYPDYNLYVGMSHPNWRLRPSGTYNMVFYIDGRFIRRARGVVQRQNTTRVWLPLLRDRYTRNRLQRGFSLTLINNRNRYKFNLTATAAGLARLENCIKYRR